MLILNYTNNLIQEMNGDYNFQQGFLLEENDLISNTNHTDLINAIVNTGLRVVASETDYLSYENVAQSEVDIFLDTMTEIFSDPDYTEQDKTAILESTYEFMLTEAEKADIPDKGSSTKKGIVKRVVRGAKDFKKGFGDVAMGRRGGITGNFQDVSRSSGKRGKMRYIGGLVGAAALGKTLGGTRVLSRASIHAKRAGKKIKQGYHTVAGKMTKDATKKAAHQKKASRAGKQSKSYGKLLRKTGIGGSGILKRD